MSLLALMSNKRISFSFLSLVKVSFLLAGFFLASGAGASSSQSEAMKQAEQVRLIVAKSVTELLVEYNQERPYYDTDPDRFLRSMDLALSKIVDFRRIAARVMGKYARKATKAQKNRFVEVFKKSLYTTYTKTLVESGVYNINVTKARLNNRNHKKATVDLDVISENGTVFPVIYSMHKNKKNVWLVENVIVFGVNIGLAFRDRFEVQFRKNKGDLDAVINTWTVDLGIKIDKGA